MFIKVEMPPYECSKCGSRKIKTDYTNIGSQYQECLDCGHDNKPDESLNMTFWIGTRDTKTPIKF